MASSDDERSDVGRPAPAEPMTFDAARRLFPITRDRAYLNAASMGPMSTPVLAAVNGVLDSIRDTGRNEYPNWCDHAEHGIKETVGKLIGADRTELALVKNTTEGLATVANGMRWRQGDNIVLPSIEYPSNVYCWSRLSRLGVELRWVDPVDGRLPIDAFRAKMDGRTRLVTFSAVQFSNGYHHDVAGMAELCRERGALLNLDGIQWVGALHVDLHAAGVDCMSFGGHKFMLAPMATGFFFCSSRALDQVEPSVVGYHSVDKSEAHLDYEPFRYREGSARFEPALENFPGFYGFEAAGKLHLALGPGRVQTHIRDLNDYAAERLESMGWTIWSPLEIPAERSGILSFAKPGADIAEIEVRLRAAHVDLAIRAGRLRISPSLYNDRSDIDRALDELERF